MITSEEMKIIIKLLKNAHINQVDSIFNYIISIIYKNKLSNEEYLKLLKTYKRRI